MACTHEIEMPNLGQTKEWMASMLCMPWVMATCVGKEHANPRSKLARCERELV
jgi:hypothetical protein